DAITGCPSTRRRVASVIASGGSWHAMSARAAAACAATTADPERRSLAAARSASSVTSSHRLGIAEKRPYDSRMWDDLDPADPPTVRWLREVAKEKLERTAVVVLLGAFDPPTKAHVAIARAASRAMSAPAALCMTKVTLDR